MKFVVILAVHGLVQLVTEVTHDAGGTLDVVYVSGDLPLPTVDVVDPELSVHRLLRWTTHLYRPRSVYTASIRRFWRTFHPEVFWADLLMTPLLDVGSYNDLDGDAFATFYNSTASQLVTDRFLLGQ